MKLLIDTHILLWADWQLDAIAPPLRTAMSDEANEIYLSAASVCEIAITRSIGKLSFDAVIITRAAEMGFEILPITGVHAEHAGGLPYHHRDPFDRLIVAQAALEGMVLGTQDPLMRPYGIATLGLDRV